MTNQSVDMKEKVLLVSHEMTYTGAPRSLLGIADILRDEGYLVSVWTLGNGPFSQEFSKHGFSVEEIDFPICASETFSEKIKYFDLVIANTIFCACFAAYAKHFTKTILYIREAGNIPQLIRDCGLCVTDLTEASHIVCVSEYAASILHNTYNCNNISIIHNYTEDFLNIIKKETSFDTVSESREMVRFLVSGTIEPRKGQAIVADAYNALSPELKKYSSLHFVGNHPDWAMDYWEYLISSSTIRFTDTLTNENGIFYHGEIRDRQTLFELYDQMDVILVPSEDEACSLVALEAAMLEKMILLSENTGAKYLVDPECVVKTGDISAWTHMMQKCIENYEWCFLNGKQNRVSYLNDATKMIYGENLLSYVKNVIQCKEVKEDFKCSVSVIVPIYNVETYLPECLNSLISQTLPGIEFICINDGSTDESLSILEKYSENNSSIQIINSENLGYGHAMNQGIKEAQGEFIGIVEPDDYIDSHMFEVLYHRAIASSSEIVKCDFYQFYGDIANRDEVYFSTAIDDSNYNRIISPRKEKNCFRFIMNTWTGIYRRKFINKYNIYHNETPGASFQDNGFWFQGFCQAERIYFVREALYHNRRDNPLSSANDKAKVYAANEEYKFIRRFLHEHPTLEDEFIGQYSMKKLHTYLYTLQRVGWEYKKEYLYAISEEFKEDKINNEIRKNALYPSEWGTIQWMIRDPDDYYNQEILGKIKISIVVYVYNSENGLDRCLKSIREQQFQDYEILCIDDGSTDASIEIINRYIVRDSRFQLIQQNEKGIASARNMGLDQSKGEYILFIDADDYMNPKMFGEAYQSIKKDNAQICVLGFSQLDEDTITSADPQFVLQGDQDFPFCPFSIAQIVGNPFLAFSGSVKDKLFQKRYLLNQDLRFQEQPAFSDLGFTFISLCKADRITTTLEKCLYLNFENISSISVDFKQIIECFYDALMAINRELCECGLYDNLNIYFKNYALHRCLWNLAILPEDIAMHFLEKLKQEGFEALGITKLAEKNAESMDEFIIYTILQEDEKYGLEKCREWRFAQEQRLVQIGSDDRNNLHAEMYNQIETNINKHEEYSKDEFSKLKSSKPGVAMTKLQNKIRKRGN